MYIDWYYTESRETERIRERTSKRVWGSGKGRREENKGERDRGFLGERESRLRWCSSISIFTMTTF